MLYYLGVFFFMPPSEPIGVFISMLSQSLVLFIIENMESHLFMLALLIGLVVNEVPFLKFLTF